MFLIRKLKYISLSLVLVIASSCLEEIGDLEKFSGGQISPIIAFPVANSTFTFEEFLTEGLSTGNVSSENGIVLLTYEKSFLSFDGADEFSFDGFPGDTIKTQSNVLLGGGTPTPPIPVGQTFSIPSHSGEFPVTQVPNSEIGSILFKAGSFNLSIETNLPLDGEAIVTFQSLTKNGVALQQSLSWAHDGSLQTVSQSEDMNDYELDIAANGLLSYDIVFNMVGVGLSIQGTEDFNVIISLDNPEYRNIFFNSFTGPLPIGSPLRDTLRVDLFDNFEVINSISLTDPRMFITLNNSFGLGAEVDFTNLTSIQNDDTPFPLNLPWNTLIVQPSPNPGSDGITEELVNNQNSNISDFVSFFPKLIAYNVNANLSESTTGPLFILDTSRISVDMRFELLLEGIIDGLSIVKEFNLNGDDLEDFIEGSLFINTTNHFPFEVDLEIDLFDENNNFLGPLIEADQQNFIDAAPVDANGASIGATEATTIIPLDQTKLDLLALTRTITVRPILFSVNSGSSIMQIGIDDQLKIAIAIEAQIEADF